MLYLSLVGEQPMPVLLPLWQLDKFSRVKLIATPTTKSVAENLIDSIHRDPVLHHLIIMPTIYVKAYDMTGTIHAIHSTLMNEKEEIVLNLSGGTKIMSLAGLQAAQKTNARLLYVSMEERNLLFFSPAQFEFEAVPISVRISINQYFSAHGIETSDSQNFGEKYSDIVPVKEGDFLEEQIYSLCRDSNFFDDVCRNLFIRRLNGDHSVINELDVAVTSNGNLAVCSCKSGKLDNRMLYELASLSRREVAGIYCGKVLATSKVPIPPGIKKRAKQDEIRLIEANELHNAAEIIYQEMQK